MYFETVIFLFFASIKWSTKLAMQLFRAVFVHKAKFIPTHDLLRPTHHVFTVLQLHDETKVLPMDTHLQLHGTHLKQLTQTQTHHLHVLNAYSDSPRNIKATIFHNNKYTNTIISDLNITSEESEELNITPEN